ncbi:MAG: glycosyltransferase family 2 protein, partial [Candidatus Acidiferrales bacterium]
MQVRTEERQAVRGEERALIAGVTVVVPAYNEEGAIASQIENVRVVMDAGGRPWELIVVDDGSTDGTAA